MTKIYGYTNCAFGNLHAEGDTSWFLTALARDVMLARKRDAAIRAGLNAGTAMVGIYSVGMMTTVDEDLIYQASENERDADDDAAEVR